MDVSATDLIVRKRRRRKRRGHGNVPPRSYEKLIERGLRGINTLPGGGLVSATASIKTGDLTGPPSASTDSLSAPFIIRDGSVFSEKKLRSAIGTLARRGSASRQARRFLRVVSLDRDAGDGDGDGTVQDGTNQERPVGPVRKLINKVRKRRKNEIFNWGEFIRKPNDPDGGFTLRLGGLQSMTSGWAVARNGDGIAIPRSAMFDREGNPTDEGVELVQAFVMEYKDVLFGTEDTADRTVTLGAWHNPLTGMVHLDVTDVFSKKSMTREQAVEMGGRRNQLSVADLDRVAVDDFSDDTFPPAGGTGGNVRDLDTLRDRVISLRRRRDRKKPFRPSQETRVTEGPEGIDMILTGQIKELAKKHGEERDWHDIVAVDSDRRKMIADFYDEAPDLSADEVSEEIREAYAAMAAEVEEQYRLLVDEMKIKIEFVDFDPYADFFEMRKDYLDNQRLLIMRTAVTGSHPFFTDEQNDKFRAVHDAFGHLATGRAFDRHGEEAAYQAHRTMFSDKAVLALATETRGQNQYLLDRGEFGPQKLIILPDEMIKSLRAWLLLSTKAFARGLRKAKLDSDKDNLYSATQSHHVTGGRVLKPGN
jgi:hypothetical protein